MKFDIRTVPDSAQRYTTVGDWYETNGTVHIVVSDLGNETYEFLVAIHELVEFWLCKVTGITDEQAVSWDRAWSSRPQPRGAEAGNDPACPYHWPHVAAGIVERFVAFVLRVDYEAYDECLNKLIDSRQGR